MAANPYRYLPLATIQTKLDQYNAAETAILTGAASYSMNGVSITRAQLSQVQQAIGWLTQALRLQSGQAAIVATPVVRPNRFPGGCY